MMHLSNGSMQLVQPLVRSLTTSSAAGSVALATKSSSAGLFGFGGSSRIDVPLSDPLPGVQLPLRGTPSAPAKLESSVLADGVKVATIGTSSPATTIALVLSGGSSLETSATAGVSKVIEAMAFKATKDRTTFRLTRELEKIGAVAYAKAGRDSITFAIDTVKLHTPEATEILLDSVLNAKLLYHEFRDNAELTKDAISKALSSPATMLEEAVHRVAYDGPLGQPLLVDPKSISHEALRAYYASILKPSSMLLAGIGADHAELTALAGPMFGAAHLKAAASAAPSSKYVGGSANIIADIPLTHVALAFEAKGGLSDSKSSALVAITKALLDETRGALPYSLSASPFKAFSHSYKDSGLVGVTASSTPEQASQLVDSVYKKVGSVVAGVTDSQLCVAKRVAIGSYKVAQAGSSSALPLIVSKLLASGKYDAAEFAASVESITAAQVGAFVKELTKSAPTLVTYGSLASLPRYDSLAKRLA